jgi:endonuclease YncB( thermonuclease family)
VADPASAGTDWHVIELVRVTDGDTVRLVRERTERLDDQEDVHRDVADPNGDGKDDGVPIRLINLDTPERGEEGYSQAKADLAAWITVHSHELMVTTWGETGGFDRFLGDLWVEGDRSNTATQYMLRDKGWLPYVRGQ